MLTVRRHEDRDSGPAASSLTGEGNYRAIVFRLHGREYAFPLATVTEVLRMVAVTEVPGSPDWLAGMINVRGCMVPVVDLRTQLGLPRSSPDLNSAIVITDVAQRGRVGFIADAMVEAAALPEDSIDVLDELGGTAHQVSSVARDGQRLILILDAGRLASDLAEMPQGTP
jgi:purine-binding chemotaxis protein CheW